MIDQTFWTRKAANRYNNIHQYLESKVDPAAARKFVRDFWNGIERLQKMPTRGRKSISDETVWYFRFDRHRVVYYKFVEGESLLIIDIFSQRQNTKNRPY